MDSYWMKSQENATVSTFKKKRKQRPRFMRIFVSSVNVSGWLQRKTKKKWLGRLVNL